MTATGKINGRSPGGLSGSYGRAGASAAYDYGVVPVTSRAASLVGKSTYATPHIGAASSYDRAPQRTVPTVAQRASAQVRRATTRAQLPAPNYSVSAGYIPYQTPIGATTYGALTQGQVGTMNPNTYIGGMTYGQLTQGQAAGGAPMTGVADPYMAQAIASALQQTRTAAGTLPNYMGLANQLQRTNVVDSPEVRRTINALLVEQGSAPIGGYDVQPGQIDSTNFYRPDGSYDWNAHNAARAAGLAVI